MCRYVTNYCVIIFISVIIYYGLSVADVRDLQSELKKFKDTGAAFNIANTLCGKIILTKPSNQTQTEFPDWREHVSLNRRTCECKRYGPPNFKYAYYWMVNARNNKFDNIFSGVYQTHYFLIENKTMHLLLQKEKIMYFYTFWHNGTLYGDATNDFTIPPHNIRNISTTEHYFSYILAVMKAEKVSISLMDSADSYWNREIDRIGRGIVGFAYDDSLKPIHGPSKFNVTNASIFYYRPNRVQLGYVSDE